MVPLLHDCGTLEFQGPRLPALALVTIVQMVFFLARTLNRAICNSWVGCSPTAADAVRCGAMEG